MGNSSSAAVSDALEDTAGAPPSTPEGATVRSARVFCFDTVANKWNVERALVDVDFADDAAEGDARDWHVEVRSQQASQAWQNPCAAAVARCCALRRGPGPPASRCAGGLCS